MGGFGKINILLRWIFFFLCYPLSAVGWVSVMSFFFVAFSFVGRKSRAIMKMCLFENGVAFRELWVALYIMLPVTFSLLLSLTHYEPAL